MLSTSYPLALSSPPTPKILFKIPQHIHTATNHHIIPSHNLPSPTTTTTPFHGRQLLPTFPSSLDSIMLMDLNPPVKLAIAFLGPFLSGFGFLFILRIVMSWYPKLPLNEFPYVIAYAPTEPFLVQTRKIIPPLGGVDVTPVVWFGLISFLNEILLGPQGLLVLLSQQV